jgi:hypothetical protein
MRQRGLEPPKDKTHRFTIYYINHSVTTAKSPMRESNPRLWLKRPQHYHYANRGIWRQWDSNPQPFACKATILPIENMSPVSPYRI